MGEVKSIKYSLVALVQGDLEIPVEVNMHWKEKSALEILKTKTEEVSYPLRGDRWQSRWIKRNFELDFQRRSSVR